jgi:hypothetical protein
MNAQPHSARRVRNFVNAIAALDDLPPTRRHRHLVLAEYPFDSQLLELSRIYRASRRMFLARGGRFSAKLFSLERSVVAQDLFDDVLEYAPAQTEMRWFKDNHHRLLDPAGEMAALDHFNAIPLFHEQNHRVIWHLLPPPAKGRENLIRYLKLAESLVIALDVALAEEIGEVSNPARRIGVVYRTAINGWSPKTAAERRQYLLAVFYTAYCRFEFIEASRLREHLERQFSDQAQSNRKAIRRSAEIADFFVDVATPQWLVLHAETAAASLKALHRGSRRPPLTLPEDPAAADAALLSCVGAVLDAFLE